MELPNELDLMIGLVDRLPHFESAIASLKAMGHESGAIGELTFVVATVTKIKAALDYNPPKPGEGEGGTPAIGSTVVDVPVEVVSMENEGGSVASH